MERPHRGSLAHSPDWGSSQQPASLCMIEGAFGSFQTSAIKLPPVFQFPKLKMPALSSREKPPCSVLSKLLTCRIWEHKKIGVILYQQVWGNNKNWTVKIKDRTLQILGQYLAMMSKYGQGLVFRGSTWGYGTFSFLSIYVVAVVASTQGLDSFSLWMFSFSLVKQTNKQNLTEWILKILLATFTNSWIGQHSWISREKEAPGSCTKWKTFLGRKEWE